MPNCREVTHLIASEEITRAGLFTRIALRMHLMMCSHCRRYSRQVGLMGAVARRLWGSGVDDPGDLKKLEAKILAASRKTPGAADWKE